MPVKEWRDAACKAWTGGGEGCLVLCPLDTVLRLSALLCPARLAGRVVCSKLPLFFFIYPHMSFLVRVARLSPRSSHFAHTVSINATPGAGDVLMMRETGSRIKERN